MAIPRTHSRPATLHRTHPSSVAFFDEAGAISSDRIFAVGLLKVADHSALLKEVKKIRKAEKYWDEFKWASVTKTNEPAILALVDLLLASDVTFSCFVADRHVADPVARFGDTFRAYEKLATQLLIGSIERYEICSVVADNYSAPNCTSFEYTVKKEINRRLNRLAVPTVLQVDSGATEGLQLVDVLLGAVAFWFKAEIGIASHASLKGRVAEELRNKISVTSFDEGFSSSRFRVRLYEHQRWLTRQQAKLLGSS